MQLTIIHFYAEIFRYSRVYKNGNIHKCLYTNYFQYIFFSRQIMYKQYGLFITNSKNLKVAQIAESFLYQGTLSYNKTILR